MKLADKLMRLREPVPKEMISFKTLKGNKIEYIAWVDICEILDSCCGADGWAWDVTDFKQIGDNLTLIGKLTVYADDGWRTMAATGCESINCSSYGDPSSNAEAMALRRAAAKLGVARNLWKKGSKADAGSRERWQKKGKPRSIDEDWKANGLKYYITQGLSRQEAESLVTQSKSKQELMEVGRLALQEKHNQTKEVLTAYENPPKNHGRM